MKRETKQKLFNFFSENYEWSLLDSEMEEIERILHEEQTPITRTENNMWAEELRKRIGQIVLGTAEDGESQFTIYDNDSVLDDIMDIVTAFTNQRKEVNQDELHNLIINVHEAMEGRYELDGFDLHSKHGAVLRLPITDGNMKRLPYKQIVNTINRMDKVVTQYLNYLDANNKENRGKVPLAERT
jgi:hypothetical protein